MCLYICNIVKFNFSITLRTVIHRYIIININTTVYGNLHNYTFTYNYIIIFHMKIYIYTYVYVSIIIGTIYIYTYINYNYIYNTIIEYMGARVCLTAKCSRYTPMYVLYIVYVI